ncbi:MAG: YaaA family protein [Galactobacter sp.]
MLLPPSEGKSRPVQGGPVDLTALSFPSLTERRSQVLEALVQTSGRDDALKTLKVGASLVDEVRANTGLLAAPAAPAHSIYSGVLYDALDYAGLSPEARTRADRDVLVVSALWGAVTFADMIPAYRLSMGVDLPGVGKLATAWRPELSAALTDRANDELVVDVRSSTYAAAAKLPPATSVAVDVVQLRGGERKVVSHFAKHTRGELIGRLLASGENPTTPEELRQIAAQWWEVELSDPSRAKPWRLTVVLPEDHRFTSR